MAGSGLRRPTGTRDGATGVTATGGRQAGDGSGAGRPARTLRERAYQEFTHRLLARDIRPGQFVSQRELVAITGMPLGAVRELVPRLEAEGLIRTVPQRGMQVAHVDLNLVRDAFQYRLFLEREAVILFAETAPDATIAALARSHADIVARCESAARNGGITPDLVAEAQEVDWGLHATVVDALGNAIVSEAYRVNAIKIRLIKKEQTRLNEDVLLPTMGEHVAIIEALERRDGPGAASALTAHLASARKRAMELR